MTLRHYKTFYLELKSPGELNPKPLPDALIVVECEEPQYQFNRFLYELVGTDYEWGDLDAWTDEQWQALVESDEHRTWVAYYRGSIAGYYELYRPDGINTEIRYFGLTPNVIGKGYGGPLLSHAINSAWSWHGTERVWVHTCTFDHPSALANYQARGMKVYKEELSPIE
ncbi:MAG: GNAT family N-acetyltransferase [Pseudomonas sp.]